MLSWLQCYTCHGVMVTMLFMPGCNCYNVVHVMLPLLQCLFVSCCLGYNVVHVMLSWLQGPPGDEGVCVTWGDRAAAGSRPGSPRVCLPQERWPFSYQGRSRLLKFITCVLAQIVFININERSCLVRKKMSWKSQTDGIETKGWA